MLEVLKKSHVPVLISSLNKAFNKVYLGKRIDVRDLFLLNIIYKLLDGCYLDLSNSQRRFLLDLYRKIYFKSDQICPGPTIKQYQMTVKNKFIQSEKGDCCDFNLGDKIFYWQEDSFVSDINNLKAEVQVTDYLDNKPYDTYANFKLGKEIDYFNIGRIVFLTLGSYNAEFKIYDIDNNDITDQFSNQKIVSLNSSLFVSKNIFSHGNIKFKIKKI